MNPNLTKRTAMWVVPELPYGRENGPAEYLRLVNDFNPLQVETTYSSVKPAYGKRPGMVQNVVDAINAQFYVQGSGTAGVAPSWVRLLEAAGWVGDYSYSIPVFRTSKDYGSFTAYTYYDGLLHVSPGARGQISFQGEVGQMFLGQFQGSALHTDRTTASIPLAPQMAMPPILCNVNFVIRDQETNTEYKPITKSMAISTTNPILRRKGAYRNQNIDKIDKLWAFDGLWSSVVELDSTYDFLDLHTKQRKFSLSMSVGATAGNKVNFATPAEGWGTLRLSPPYTDNKGIRVINLEFELGSKTENYLEVSFE